MKKMKNIDFTIDDTVNTFLSKDDEYLIHKNLAGLDYGISRILEEIVKCEEDKYTYYV